VNDGYQFPSDTEMKPLLVQLVPGDPCLFHVALWQEEASILFVAALQVLEYCDVAPTEPSLLQGEET